MKKLKAHFFDMDHTLINADCDVTWKEFMVAEKQAPESDLAEVKSALEKLKETVKGNDTDAIKADTEALEKSFYKISEKLYAQQQAQGGQDFGGGAQGGDGTYYNAGYEDKTNQ